MIIEIIDETVLVEALGAAEAEIAWLDIRDSINASGAHCYSNAICTG